MSETPPPLRVREADGAPNVIPVYEIVVSGATLTRQGPTGVQLLIDSGAGATAAPTGASYVTISLDATLTAERTLAAGTGLTLVDAGANSAATISMIVPVSVSSGGTGQSSLTAFGVLYGSGGSSVQAIPAMASGQLIVGSGANLRPHILGTGATGQYLSWTGGSVIGNVAWINTQAIGADLGNQYVVMAAAADLTAERILAAGTGLTLVDGGAGGNATLAMVVPVSVSSGGTGQSTHTAFGVLYGSGGSAIQAMPAMASGQILVGSGSNMRPHILNTGATGQYLAWSSGVIGAMTWIDTAAAGGGGTQTVRIPLPLLSVKISSANAFYTAKSGANLDAAHTAFVDSGTGIASYWGHVPNNVNATENWNIYFTHEAESGSGGNVVLTLRGNVSSDGNTIDVAPTTIISTATYLVNTFDRLTVSSFGAAVLDGSMGLAANNYLRVVIERSGGHASDAVNAQWNLKYVALQCDVNS